MVLGLGWGLAVGLLDSLPSLVEGDLLTDLGPRLLAVAYLMVVDALAFALLLALVGLAVGAVRTVLRRPGAWALPAWIALGLCAAGTAAAALLQRYPDASPALALALALAAGAALAALVRWAAPPSRPRRLERVVLALFGACLVFLLGTALFRATARDWPLFNQRVTDQRPTPERPNLVLISIDALRADRLGLYGNEAPASPRIDELGRRGVVFRQAVSQGSSTVPSVSSFLTSLYPSELGIIAGRDWFVDDLRVTLAEALQAAGYRTQAFVTNGHLVPENGYAQGFDGYTAPRPRLPYGLDRLRAEPAVAGLACRSAVLCDLFGAGYRLLLDPQLAMEDEGGRVNELARRFLRLHRDEQFFLWLHYMEPHAAYNPRQPVGPLPASVDAVREQTLRTWQPSDKTVPAVMPALSGPGTAPSDDLTALLSLYDGEIVDVDRWVGAIWDEIEAQGLADRTLLVLTADHGDEFGDHGGWGHGHTVYQELEWVPLLVVGPQVATPGRQVETAVPLLDIMPTLLDAARAPVPELMEGQSLLPVLGGGEPPERVLFSESPARRSSYDDRALRMGDYKLVYRGGLDRAELYNLRTDPGEQHDLAAVEPERTAAMRADLRAWTARALETWAALPQSGTAPGEVDAAVEDALRQIGY